MVVLIQGHTYEMPKKQFNQYIKQIKKMIPDCPTLLAIEKDEKVEMRNDMFSSQAELTAAIHKWNKQGYICKYYRGFRGI